jgi:hypothetical protein
MYEGADENNDGIGDIPYQIAGGNTNDSYPLMSPWQQENNKPRRPQIHGPRIGKISREYTFTINASDSNGDAIFYLIDWGDNQTQTAGPFHQGSTKSLQHSWSNQGTYQIRVRTMDPYDTESLLTRYLVWIPFQIDSIVYGFFEKLFETYPHAFPFLRSILGF